MTIFATAFPVSGPTIMALLQTAALIGTGYDKGKLGYEQKIYHQPK
jgi:hypothetical protein